MPVASHAEGSRGGYVIEGRLCWGKMSVMPSAWRNEDVRLGCDVVKLGKRVMDV
jgi:hypothetical protein